MTLFYFKMRHILIDDYMEIKVCMQINIYIDRLTERCIDIQIERDLRVKQSPLFMLSVADRLINSANFFKRVPYFLTLYVFMYLHIYIHTIKNVKSTVHINMNFIIRVSRSRQLETIVSRSRQLGTGCPCSGSWQSGSPDPGSGNQSLAS